MSATPTKSNGEPPCDMKAKLPQNGPCKGRLAALDILLKQGVSPSNTLDPDTGWTALHAACAGGHRRLTRALLDQGCNLNIQDVDGHTALHLAAIGGHLELVHLLLYNGANAVILDHLQRSALLAVLDLTTNLKSEPRLAVANALISVCDINKSNDKGVTPVHLAAYWGFGQLVRDLLVMGANANARDIKGRTALHYALSDGHRASQATLHALLTHGADLHLNDGQGHNCLDGFVNVGKDDYRKSGIHSKNSWQEGDFRKSLLGLAILSGNTNVCRSLVSAGIELDTHDKYGYTPLHLAVICGQEELLGLLLQKNCNVNAVDPYTQSALHLAALNSRPSMAAALVGAGADVNLQDEAGMTPLHRAAGWSTCELVQLLLAYGAQTDLTDNQNRTPVDIARVQGNSVVLGFLEKYCEKPFCLTRQRRESFRMLDTSINDAIYLLTHICDMPAPCDNSDTTSITSTYDMPSLRIIEDGDSIENNTCSSATPCTPRRTHKKHTRSLEKSSKTRPAAAEHSHICRRVVNRLRRLSQYSHSVNIPPIRRSDSDDELQYCKRSVSAQDLKLQAKMDQETNALYRAIHDILPAVRRRVRDQMTESSARSSMTCDQAVQVKYTKRKKHKRRYRHFLLCCSGKAY